ncbi:MAG: RES family NAD+ phosphorylase [Pseudolabrys sp.]|nr:RES family NAD+ phosphorylase [Pseudolabrys sp.]
MRLWRLSSVRRAHDFDGGYGLLNNGRWNTRGRPVTYCATTPSLAALEKRVHVADPSLFPPQMMVEYEAPDDLPMRSLSWDELPSDWTTRETETQSIGDAWLDATEEALLFVPSVIIPLANAPERNVLINHRHAASSQITFVAATAFALDPRLFQP